MASTNFINECKNRANANRLGKIIVDGLTSPITNSDNLQSFEIDSGCYADGNIIGTVYAKCLNANFIASQDNLVDKPVQVQIGVKYANLSTEYINLGKYIVERPNNEITAQYSQITAYSSLYTKLDDKYVCNIDYSKGNVTLKDLYVDVCNQLGLIPNTTTFTNSTIPIVANPFTNGEKNRTVLQIIAKISCSFIDIDNDSNKIDLCWLSSNTTPDYTFNFGDYVNVEGGQIICGPINCLIIKNSQIEDENVTIKDDESIKQNGEHSITISEDYILHNAELRQQAINSIWNKVKGMKYVDCKLTTYYGKPFLKLGDKIRIYINKTEYFDTYVLKHKFTYDGSFTSIIESPALTEQEIKNKQDTNLAKLLSETQIDVNKQLKKITASVSEIDSTLNSITTTNKTVSNKNSLYIEDALEENALEFRVQGKSEQTTYTGKNLFNYVDELISSIHGLTSTLNKDGSITTTGIPTQEYFSIVNSKDITDILEDNQIYSVNVDNAYPYLYFQVQAVNKDGTRRYHATVNSKQAQFLVDKSTFSTYIISIIVGTSANWGTASRTITNRYMLCKGTDTTFEPYVGGTSSPNPSYPQEIDTIKGIENLIDITVNKKDVITKYKSFINGNFEVIAGQTYALSFDTNNNNGRVYANEAIFNYMATRCDGTRKTLILTAKVTNIYENTTILKTSDDVSIAYDLSNIQLEKGIISHTCVPRGNWLVEKITGNNSFNMLDETNFNFRMKGNSPNYQSFKLIEKTSNEIKVSGGGGNYTEAWIDISGLTPNTKYSLSYTIKDNTLGYNPTMKLQSNGITDANGNITIALGLGNGTTTVETNKYVTFTNIQLEKGSASTKYEPYKEQNIMINLNKDNLFDKDTNITEHLFYNVSNGQQLLGSSIVWNQSDFIQTNYNQYTLYSSYKENNMSFEITQFDSSQNWLKTTQLSLTNGMYTFIKEVNTKYIKIGFRYDRGTELNIRLIEGVDSYHELCSNKDLSVRDELVVTETETFIDKKIGKAIFDGSDDEGWVLSANAPNQNNTIYFVSSKADSLFSEIAVLSNYFTMQYDLWNHDKEGIYYDAAHGSSIRIRINKTTASTVTEFKTWLSTHNLEIQGILSTPEKIELDKVDIPLYENINNLTLLEDLETDTSVKYLLKTPISEDYITKHEANAKIKITKDSITQLANETETNLNSVNQKYAETKLASDGLSISVADIQKNVNSQQEDISNINSNVNKTNSELNNLKNNINSTNEVVTKMNYSFGTKELTINKETDPVNTGISNKGMIVRNYTTIKTVANDKGLGTDDLIVTNTAQIGYLKFMKSTDENGKLVTDIHHLVSNIQQVSDLVGD